MKFTQICIYIYMCVCVIGFPIMGPIIIPSKSGRINPPFSQSMVSPGYFVHGSIQSSRAPQLHPKRPHVKVVAWLGRFAAASFSRRVIGDALEPEITAKIQLGTRNPGGSWWWLNHLFTHHKFLLKNRSFWIKSWGFFGWFFGMPLEIYPLVMTNIAMV